MGKKILVAGAGASGLMAAIAAARAGAAVTVLEAMERPGKKLLVTGNGRCNLTNMNPQLASTYHSPDPSFVETVISRLDANQTRDFFTELGLLTVEKNGYVYPYTNQASSVLEVLLAELRRLGVRLKLSERIEEIHRVDGRWQVRTATWTYEADALILCCGSKCAPSTGSDGSGYTLANALGLKLRPVTPALVPLLCEGAYLPTLAGVRCQAKIALYQSCQKQPGAHLQEQSARAAKQSGTRLQDPARAAKQSGTRLQEQPARAAERPSARLSEQPARAAERPSTRLPEATKQPASREQWQKIGEETGELQWTKYGISGIAVFQLSRFVAAAGPDVSFRVRLDFFPSHQTDELLSFLFHRAAALTKEKVPVLLRGVLPEKLIPVVLDRSGISQKTGCAALTEPDLRRLLQTCRAFELKIKGTKSFDVAQVCAGGVALGELCPETLECRRFPGLFLAGELLDVDGPCGGYNLQWAWASGYVAGVHAAGQAEASQTAAT